MKSSMKYLMVISSLLFASSSFAKTYYFSSSAGKDSRTSTEAQNPATPWQTIDKLNSYFTSLQPGDSVLFKKGDTFYGGIQVTKSGTSGNPIVISSYGSGNKPVISGFVTLTNWTSVGGGIYESYNAGLGPVVRNLIINNKVQEIGRYPNSDAPNKGYLTIDSYNALTSITDAALPTSPNWTGGEVVIRENRWTIVRCNITSQSGSTLYYTAVTSDKPKVGFGYFVQNHIKTLDKYGEWYYNPATKKMSVFFGSNFSSGNVVKASVVDFLVRLNSGTNYVTVDGLTLEGANEDAVVVQKGNYNTVTNCDMQFSGQNGVDVTSNSYFRVENCSIINSNNRGVAISAGNTYPTVKNNKIQNTGVIIGMGGSGIGISCSSPNSTIDNNSVINSGFQGITFANDYSVVSNNVVDSFGFVKDDGAGIYTYVGSVNTNHTGRKVINNLVMNGLGAPEGANATNNEIEGIYMDDNVSGVEISGNTVSNCNRGLYIHNSRNIVVSNNTIYDNNLQLYIKHDGLANAVSNITMKNNVFFSKYAGQQVALFSSSTSDNNLTSMGTYDNNFYCRPIDGDNQVIEYSYKDASNNTISGETDLTGWQKMFGKDLNSKNSPTALPTYTIKSLIGSNKFTNSTFATDVKGVYGSKCTLSLVSGSLLDKTYMKVVPYDRKSSLAIGVGTLTAGKNYVLKFSIAGESNFKSISAFLRYGGTPYSPITPMYNRNISTTKNDYEIVLTPTVSQTSGTLIFAIDGMDTYYIDNISLYEADVVTSDVNDLIKFKYNTSTNSSTQLLDISRVDPKGKWYTSNVVLQPKGSAILMKSASSTVTTTVTQAAVTPTDATLNPIADAFIRGGGYANSNYGTDLSLVHKGTTNTGYARASYLKFALDNVSSVGSAKLRVYGNNTDNSSTINISAFGVSDDSWTETGINWNNAPSSATSVLGTLAVTNTAKYYEIDVTSYIKAQLSSDKTASFVLEDIANLVTTVTFNSRENASNKPQLVITAAAQTAPVTAFDAAMHTPTDMIATNTSVSLYPNPAQHDLRITLGAANSAVKQIKIMNAAGAVMKTISVSAADRVLSVDVSAFKSGVYLVNLYTNDKVVTEKFVKM